MNSIRILQVLTLDINSGVASVVINLYRNIRSQDVCFEFITWNINRENSYINEIENNGDRVFVIPYYKQDWIGFRKKVISILSNKRYDGIHCHEYLLSIPFLYWGKSSGIPLRIAHSHNPTIDSWIKQRITVFGRFAFNRFANVYMACSQEAADFLFGKKNNVIILKNGIDTNMYRYSEKKRNEIRNQLNIENQFVVGNIGRLTSQKNQMFLLQIFFELLNDVPNSALIIAGDGEFRKKLEQETQRLGIENRVLFLGKRKDIPELLSAMDVFVLPSLYEGLPLVLVEAQANGLPCLVTNTINDKVKINENLEFLSLDDYKSWSEKIQNIKRIPCGEDKVNLAGYDIMQSSEILKEVYMSKSSTKKANNEL